MKRFVWLIPLLVIAVAPQLGAQPPRLTVAAPAGQRLSPVTMLYSSSTPEAGIDAEVVAAGLGRQGDFIGRAVEGKIALIERGEIIFSDKGATAAAAAEGGGDSR